MELVRLIRTGPGTVSTSPGNVQDEVAQQARRVEIQRPTELMVGLFWLAAVIWPMMILTKTAEMLSEGGWRGGMYALSALGIWTVLVGLVGWFLRRSGRSLANPFLPWRQVGRLRRMMHSGLLLQVLLMVVYSAASVMFHGWSNDILGALFVLASILSFVFATVPPHRGKNLGNRRDGIQIGASIAALAGAVVFLGKTSPVVYAVLAIPALSIVFAFLWARQTVIVASTISGRHASLDRTQLAGTAFSWVDAEHGLRAHLPDGDTVEGSEALRLAARALNDLNKTVPPWPGVMDQAWKLVRAVGDLRGLLAMLVGYRDGQSGRIDFRSLPQVYRLALDLALAGQAPWAQATLLREASALARATADEADTLDRELFPPANSRNGQ